MKDIRDKIIEKMGSLIDELAAHGLKRELQIESLFDAIAHGDEEHQRWLREKITEHFAKEP